MKRPKELKRRLHLWQIARQLRRLSRQPVPHLSGEAFLRNQVRQHVEREARLGGIDAASTHDLERIIDSHVVELRAEIIRRHQAEEAEIGMLQAQLDGVTAQYVVTEHGLNDRVEQAGYWRKDALWHVEDRDIPKPAGPNGVDEGGYGQGKVSELAGRNLRSRIILYIVMVLAMVADLITFRQVVERIANDSMVFPLVLAITVITTYVAHKAGELFKSAKEDLRNLRRAVGGWIHGGIWAVVGIGAFVFRLLAPAPAGANAVADFVSGSTSGSADPSAALNATIMLLLYLLTGVVATAAGYQRPRPEINQFQRADRKIRRAGPRQAFLRRDVVEAEALRQRLGELQANRAEQYQIELKRCDSAAIRVKAETSMLTRQLLRLGDRRLRERILPFRRRSQQPVMDLPEVTRDLSGLRPANADAPTVEFRAATWPAAGQQSRGTVYPRKQRGRAKVPRPGTVVDGQFSEGDANSSTQPENPAR